MLTVSNLPVDVAGTIDAAGELQLTGSYATPSTAPKYLVEVTSFRARVTTNGQLDGTLTEHTIGNAGEQTVSVPFTASRRPDLLGLAGSVPGRYQGLYYSQACRPAPGTIFCPLNGIFFIFGFVLDLTASGDAFHGQMQLTSGGDSNDHFDVSARLDGRRLVLTTVNSTFQFPDCAIPLQAWHTMTVDCTVRTQGIANRLPAESDLRFFHIIKILP